LVEYSSCYGVDLLPPVFAVRKTGRLCVVGGCLDQQIVLSQNPTSLKTWIMTACVAASISWQELFTKALP
jgi:hypothetical protein